MSRATRKADDPIHILHVVGGMNRGGIETWLMHILRHTDRERFRMDFVVHTSQPGAYDDEVRALGSRTIPCLHPSRPWMYARNLRRILREYGPYDVVHSHVHHYSGHVLRVAHQEGIPVRIAHSHNDTSEVDAAGHWLRRGYLNLMRSWIARYATIGPAASREAGAALFGPAWESDPRWQILYYGIDLAPFRNHVDPDAVRAELSIPAHAFVIGHVGRFAEQKNHRFLVDIVAEVVRHEPAARLLLVGDGPLRPAIEQRVTQLGLSEHVIFAGLRSDVPRLMRGAMDLFLFPSLYEGLPVVGIEVQAAGLPAILSDVISKETDAIKQLVRRLSLSQPSAEWAKAVLEACTTPAPISRPEALAVMEKSPFNILHSLKMLESIYACEQQ